MRREELFIDEGIRKRESLPFNYFHLRPLHFLFGFVLILSRRDPIPAFGITLQWRGERPSLIIDQRWATRNR
jgi:hypothetical protein